MSVRNITSKGPGYDLTIAGGGGGGSGATGPTGPTGPAPPPAAAFAAFSLVSQSIGIDNTLDIDFELVNVQTDGYNTTTGTAVRINNPGTYEVTVQVSAVQVGETATVLTLGLSTPLPEGNAVSALLTGSTTPSIVSGKWLIVVDTAFTDLVVTATTSGGNATLTTLPASVDPEGPAAVPSASLRIVRVV